MRSQPRGWIGPSSAACERPHQLRGRREGRVPTGTHGPRAKEVHGAGTTGSAGNNPAFPARWFERLLRALPGDRACLPPSSGCRRPRHQHRGVGTTRLDRPRNDVRPHPKGDAASPRGHRSPPQRLVTIAMRPSQCGRDGGKCAGDLPDDPRGISTTGSLYRAGIRWPTYELAETARAAQRHRHCLTYVSLNDTYVGT